MNEETLLEQQFGKSNPFRVPEGYFSDFEKQLLADISATSVTEKPLFRRLVPWLWTAGTAAAVFAGTLFYIGNQASDTQQYTDNTNKTVIPQHDNTDLIIDRMSDYAMLDNSDFYSYVADE